MRPRGRSEGSLRIATAGGTKQSDNQQHFGSSSDGRDCRRTHGVPHGCCGSTRNGGGKEALPSAQLNAVLIETNGGSSEAPCQDAVDQVNRNSGVDGDHLLGTAESPAGLHVPKCRAGAQRPRGRKGRESDFEPEIDGIDVVATGGRKRQSRTRLPYQPPRASVGAWSIGGNPAPPSARPCPEQKKHRNQTYPGK